MNVAKLSVSSDTHRCLMSSESIVLNDSVRLRVPKRCCQSVSEDQGRVVEKKSLSCSRARSQVAPSIRSLVDGCLTANHPFVRCSASFLMKRNQCSSSPEGIRSGLVRTPTRDQPREIVTGASLRTNGPLSIRVILLCHVVGTLIFKVGFVGSQCQGR